MSKNYMLAKLINCGLKIYNHSHVDYLAGAYLGDLSLIEANEPFFILEKNKYASDFDLKILTLEGVIGWVFVRSENLVFIC